MYTHSGNRWPSNSFRSLKNYHVFFGRRCRCGIRWLKEAKPMFRYPSTWTRFADALGISRLRRTLNAEWGAVGGIRLCASNATPTSWRNGGRHAANSNGIPRWEDVNLQQTRYFHESFPNWAIEEDEDCCEVQFTKANREGDDSRLVSITSGGKTVRQALEKAARKVQESRYLEHGPRYHMNSFAIFQYIVSGEEADSLVEGSELSQGNVETYFDAPLLGVCVKHLRGVDESPSDFPINGKLTVVTLPNDVTVEPFTSSITELPPLRDYSQLISQRKNDTVAQNIPLTFWLFCNSDIVPSEVHSYMDRVERIFPNAYIASNISHRPRTMTGSSTRTNASRRKGVISPLRVDKCDVVGIAVQGDLDNEFYLSLTRAIYGDSSDTVYMGKKLDKDLHHSLNRYIGCAIQSTPPVVEIWWPQAGGARNSNSSPYTPNPFVSDGLARLYEKFDITDRRSVSTHVPEELQVDILLRAEECFKTMNLQTFKGALPTNIHYLVPGERAIFELKEPRTKYMLYRYFEHGEPIVVSPALEDTGLVSNESSSAHSRLMNHKEKERSFQASSGLTQFGKEWEQRFGEVYKAVEEARLALRDLNNAHKLNDYSESGRFPDGFAVGTLAVVRTLFNMEDDGSVLVELEGVRRAHLTSVWTAEGGFGLQQASGEWYDDATPEPGAEMVADVLRTLLDGSEAPFQHAQLDLQRWASHPSRLFHRSPLDIRDAPPEALSWWLAEIMPVPHRTKLQYLRLRSSRHRLALQLTEILNRAYRKEVSTKGADPKESLAK